MVGVVGRHLVLGSALSLTMFAACVLEVGGLSPVGTGGAGGTPTTGGGPAGPGPGGMGGATTTGGGGGQGPGGSGGGGSPPVLDGAIDAGYNHTCVLNDAEEVRCWGQNDQGQLGDGTTTDRNAAQLVAGLSQVKSLAVGPITTCVLDGSTNHQCFGRNQHGQFGNGQILAAPVTSPSPGATSLSNIGMMSMGSFHQCFALGMGEAWCAGLGTSGELGDGNGVSSNVAVRVAGGLTYDAVSAGFIHSCGLTNTGSVSCWGNNNSGQFGNGTTNSADDPQPADMGLANVAEVVAGFSLTCARTTTGEVLCAGFNSSGQAGSPPQMATLTVPTLVAGISGAIDIDLGERHACAAISDGTVKCWGDNGSGQLGDGTTTGTHTPVTVANITNAVGVATGDEHSCARLEDNSVLCWGDNTFGQLGNGSNTASLVPVPVQGL